MSIINVKDTNKTFDKNEGMLFGMYYYYLDNNLLTENDNLSVLLQLPTIQTLSYLPFFNSNDLSMRKSKIDKEYFKLNKDYSNLDVYRLFTGRYIKSLPTINIQDKLTKAYNNKKSSALMVYPYRYFLLSDGINPPLLIKPQNLIRQSTITPIVETYITQSSKYKIYVKENINDENGELESIINNTSFLLPIGTNVYNNFLVTSGNTYQATNSLAFLENEKNLNQATERLNLNNEQNTVNGLISVLGNLFTGNIMGGITSGVNSAYKYIENDMSKNQMLENYQFKNYQLETQILASKKDYLNTPRTMKTLGNDGMFNLMNTKGKLRLYEFNCSSEQQYRLDKYYKNYGYKINRYKKPQFNSKKYYNFIKTNNCNIDSSKIPLEHIRQLEQIFNSGLTFWHVQNGVEVGNYSVKNDDV